MSTFTQSIPNPPAPLLRQKNWFQRHWVLALVGGCLLLILLFVGFIAGIFTIVESSIKKSDAYTQALTSARNNPSVIEKFGQPLQPGWMISGNIQVSGPSGNANLSIPITGPKAKGTIYVVAKKSAGRWNFDTLEVEAEGVPEQINLLSPSAPTGTGQLAPSPQVQ
jgi:hypothetical protein